MTEALNEHHRMLRMRGRPKIRMATTYQDAIAIYNKYRNNILGVISISVTRSTISAFM
jgi:hypothetical protein